jgi:FkbM family methyltransferase
MAKVEWSRFLQNRLKSSLIRRLYWSVAKKNVLAASRREEDFYRKLLAGLRHEDIIFDVGANQGSKADIFLRLGARVIAVEPDRACQRILRDRFLRYRIKQGKVTVVGKAVSDQSGVGEMWIDGPGSAVNTMSRKWANHLKGNRENFKHDHCGLQFSRSKLVETTTIEDLVKLFGMPFFIKIDVEGYELSVLRGLRQPVPFLSFEVNLSTFRQQGIECVWFLRGLKSDGRFNYTPECCAGLVLEEWLPSEEFCAVLNSCADETIEVFWRSNCGVVRSQVAG